MNLTSCTAFNRTTLIATGPPLDVALAAKAVVDSDPQAQILIFDDVTSELIEVDFRGPAESVERQFARVEENRGRGRPKLGVVAREVTLLPRHWDWLALQPGGASVALRKLVEQAARSNRELDVQRRAQEATYRFILALAGDEPGFEEATRALFRGERDRFLRLISEWPEGVQRHAAKLFSVGGE